MLRLLTLCAGVLIACLAGGCRDREIRAYRAPKDPVAPATPAGPAAVSTNTGELPEGHPPIDGQPAVGPVAARGAEMAGTAVPTAAGGELTWTAPAGWSPKPGSAMRKGSFAVSGEGGDADLAITAFPGDTGGLEANLNRWRGQVGLAAQGGPELVAALERFSANGLEITVADYTGANGIRLLGAIVPHAGNTWFFKLMGPEATVAAAKPAFLDFLRTVQPR